MESSEEQAFLRTICDEPHDDVPRLVFADWLDEQGYSERAEFIRLQCHLASLETDDPERLALEKREKQLWQKHAREWREILPAKIRYSPFQRGFPHPTNLQLGPEQFLELPEECLECAPLWNIKLFLHADVDLESFHSSARLQKIAHLEVHSADTDGEQLQQLLRTKHFRNLQSLKWIGHPFGVDHLQTIGSSVFFPRLQKLAVFCNPLGPEGAEVLANAPGFAQLQTLDLNTCNIGDMGLRAIVTSPHLQQLRELHLPQNNLTIDSARLLMQTKYLPHLRDLNLYFNHLGDDGAWALSCSPAMEHLKRLDLGLNRIGPPGARALAQSPYLIRVQQLYLGGNRIADDPNALLALRNRFGGRVMV